MLIQKSKAKKLRKTIKKKIPAVRNKEFHKLVFACAFWFYLIVVSANCIAQVKADPDSSGTKNTQYGFVAFTDFRNSFVLSDLKEFFLKSVPVTIYGAAAGLEFRNAHQYTIGYYWLAKYAERRLADASGVAANERWKLKFINVGYTYTFFDKGKFECRIPLDIGIGKGTITSVDSNRITTNTAGLIIPFQFGFLLDYELTRWIGLSASVGYRKTIKGSIFKRNFDSPYYTVGLSFYFGNIKDDVLRYFKNKKAKKKKAKIE